MDAPTNIRFLKTLVIGLGITILICGAIVIAALVSRSSSYVESGTAGLKSGSSFTSFDPKKIDLPKGARVIELRTDAGRMILRIRQIGGNEQILLLDLATGNQIGAFDIDSSE